jgi:hypothetical protein
MHQVSPVSVLGTPEYPQSDSTSEQPRRAISRADSSIGQASTGPSNEKWRLFCDVASSSAGPFTSHAWMTSALQSLHGIVAGHLYDCSGLGCGNGFKSRRGLTAHLFTSHNDDTSFSCNYCKRWFSRDVFAIHAPRQSCPSTCAKYRFCPLPYCKKFKVSTQPPSELDKLQHHLSTEHLLGERTVFTNVLEQLGYDTSTCKVICPVCPPKAHLSGHAEFYEHFMQFHFTGPQFARHMDDSCPEECDSRKARMRGCTHVPDEVREARRAILRLLPDFMYCPVWDDIKECPST